jgi:NADH:ubiquinone oxidoreductase subunit 6 (subunit J)
MLCLILTFFLVSGLCLIFGCEFLSLLLIFVYVGSISILFLFAAMFLDLWAFRLCDVNLASTFFCAVLQGNLLPLYCNWFCNWFTYSVSSLIWAVNGSSLNQCLQHYHFQWIDLYSAKSNHSNIYALCLFLYSDYYLPFILAAYQPSNYLTSPSLRFYLSNMKIRPKDSNSKHQNIHWFNFTQNIVSIHEKTSSHNFTYWSSHASPTLTRQSRMLLNPSLIRCNIMLSKLLKHDSEAKNITSNMKIQH